MADNATIEQTSTLTPVKRWIEEIDMAEKELEKFHERGRRVVKKFLDERDMVESGNKWFNVFYANVNILESALYAQLPKPAVSRRFKDYQDDVARVAALMVQRAITQDLDDPRDTFDSTMKHCVQDRLIPGLAAAWLRLETDTADIPYEDTTPDQSAPQAPKDYVPLKKISDQRICVDYVYWQDFVFSPCRTWEERRWVGRKVYMTRDELIRRFGEKKGKSVPLDQVSGKHDRITPGSTPKHEVMKKACVYEIWNREDRKVYWISKAAPELLDEKDDPLGLVGFEPCPMPMLANISTSNTVPRPDYYLVQDQYSELDTLNNRISMLVQACKVVGCYDQSASGVARMLNEGFDNQLIPVDNWAGFAEKGGLKGSIDWLPLEVVVTALAKLIENREMVKAQIYELTGISDIVRGATKASETLGAQELKSKFASISIKKRQDAVADFASQILRIKAEMQIKHFSPEMLVKKSNIEATGEGNVEFIPAALALLKDEDGFEWKIQVTADSIAQADYAMEKADRIEFLTAVSGFIEKASAMTQAVPQAMPMMVALLKWGVAGFRNSSEIEGMLDKELDKLQKPGNENQDKGPTPEEQKAQAETEALKQDTAAKQAAAQQKMQADQAAAAQKASADQAAAAAKARLDQLAVQKEEAALVQQQRLFQLEIDKAEMALDFQRREMELKEQKLENEAKAAKAERKETLQ